MAQGPPNSLLTLACADPHSLSLDSLPIFLAPPHTQRRGPSCPNPPRNLSSPVLPRGSPVLLRRDAVAVRRRGNHRAAGLLLCSFWIGHDPADATTSSPSRSPEPPPRLPPPRRMPRHPLPRRRHRVSPPPPLSNAGEGCALPLSSLPLHTRSRPVPVLAVLRPHIAAPPHRCSCFCCRPDLAPSPSLAPLPPPMRRVRPLAPTPRSAPLPLASP